MGIGRLVRPIASRANLRHKCHYTDSRILRLQVFDKLAANLLAEGAIDGYHIYVRKAAKHSCALW